MFSVSIKSEGGDWLVIYFVTSQAESLFHWSGVEYYTSAELNKLL